MRLTSLRGKIFLLVGLTLVLSAVAVQIITERAVTKAIMASEKQAVDNVLELLHRDSEARWGDWLNYKITTVRNDRAQLVQSGNIISSVLNLYADQARRGIISRTQAQQLARQWINNLHIGSGQHGFVFDQSLVVMAADRRAMRQRNLSSLQDFKGHDLAASAYREARATGHSFALYHQPTKNDNQGKLRYAYFLYFAPWDWILATSGDAGAVVAQLQARRQAMQDSISQALRQMQLAQSGFVFIAADNGQFVSPPPDQYIGLLDRRDPDSSSTLRQMLQDVPPGGTISTFEFAGKAGHGPWQISATYFKPLGWTIVAAVAKRELKQPAIAVRNRLLWIFALALLLSLAVAWLWSARLARPLRDLAAFARKLPEQDLNAPADIPAHIQALPRTHSDEVGHLADTFMYMDQQLRDKIASLLRETSSRERFESELNIAHDIQMGLLPTPLPETMQQQVDLHATMTPARHVGGDLYDYFALADGRLCFAIGDVSDKGVPAALFMAVTRTLIRASAEDETDPAALLTRINNRLSENNPNMMFVTLMIAILNPATGELTWGNAGHLPPCVIGVDGTVRELEGRSGPACGVQEALSYCTLTGRLEPGETLLGCTDGVTEAHNRDGDQYEECRLYEQLRDQAAATAAQITARVLDSVHDFVDGAEQFDDITVIAVKRVLP